MTVDRESADKVMAKFRRHVDANFDLVPESLWNARSGRHAKWNVVKVGDYRRLSDGTEITPSYVAKRIKLHQSRIRRKRARARLDDDDDVEITCAGPHNRS